MLHAKGCFQSGGRQGCQWSWLTSMTGPPGCAVVVSHLRAIAHKKPVQAETGLALLPLRALEGTQRPSEAFSILLLLLGWNVVSVSSYLGFDPLDHLQQ